MNFYSRGSIFHQKILASESTFFVEFDDVHYLIVIITDTNKYF